MKKYGPILKDGFTLILVSTIFVVAVNAGFKSLKKNGDADPLVTAIAQENLDAAREEIGGADASVRANRADERGRTPLMWAAYANFSDSKQTGEADAKRISFVDMLLERGADVHAADKDGWTALSWAAWSGLKQVSEKLLSRGASLAVVDARGNTPLMIAVLRGNVEIVRLFIQQGADTASVRKDGKSVKAILEAARKATPSLEPTFVEIQGLLKI